jgi:CBS domain-containing protein
MRIQEEVEILRIYVGESAQHEGSPIYEAVVNLARSSGMSGATVTRGMMGFGANSLVHTAKILRLSEDLPILVEIVDKPERIESFLPKVEELVTEGLIVVDKARAIFHLPMRIRDVMNSKVVTANPDSPLSNVVRLLLKHKIKALPVVEKGWLVGVVTGGDLLSRAVIGLRLDLQHHLPPEILAEEIRRIEAGGGRASDIMSSPVITVSVKAKIPEAAKLMAKRKLKRLPVVDDDGRLVGIVSRVDVLKTVSRANYVSQVLPHLAPGLKLCAGDVMFREVPTILAQSPLNEVLDKLVASPLRRVVVVDEVGKVKGIIMDRHLIERFSPQEKHGLLRSLLSRLASPHNKPDFSGKAEDVMKPDVYTVSTSTPVTQVLEILVEKSVKRLIVVDDAGKLQGIVDRDTLLRVIAGKEVEEDDLPESV